MNNRKERFQRKMQSFLSGRNGMDILGRDIYVASLILFLVEIFLRTKVIYIIALAGLCYGIFRTFSRNLLSRQRENRKHLAFKDRIAKHFRLLKRRWKERKTHKYYKCPSCRQMIRVPKGKGKIEIRCPKCSGTFIKKT